jgi:hypothetical protein
VSGGPWRCQGGRSRAPSAYETGLGCNDIQQAASPLIGWDTRRRVLKTKRISKQGEKSQCRAERRPHNGALCLRGDSNEASQRSAAKFQKYNWEIGWCPRLQASQRSRRWTVCSQGRSRAEILPQNKALWGEQRRSGTRCKWGAGPSG